MLLRNENPENTEKPENPEKNMKNSVIKLKSPSLIVPVTDMTPR